MLWLGRVSIPLGSIKTQREFDTVEEAVKVSIPLGSIKTLFLRASPAERDVFQFHLVRLRQIAEYERATGRKVSIPLGSIKTRSCFPCPRP